MSLASRQGRDGSTSNKNGTARGRAGRLARRLPNSFRYGTVRHGTERPSPNDSSNGREGRHMRHGSRRYLKCELGTNAKTQTWLSGDVKIGIWVSRLIGGVPERYLLTTYCRSSKHLLLTYTVGEVLMASGKPLGGAGLGSEGMPFWPPYLGMYLPGRQVL